MQLIDLEASKNGRRYLPTDREAAYLHWKTAGSRSLRKTAEALDVSPSTLGNWHHEDGWKKRVDAEDREDAKSMHGGVRMRAVAGLDTNMAVMEEIRDSKTAANRDRIEAIKWLSGIAGVAPIVKSETLFTQQGGDRDDPHHEGTTELRGLSPDQLMQEEQSYKSRRGAA